MTDISAHELIQPRNLYCNSLLSLWAKSCLDLVSGQSNRDMLRARDDLICFLGGGVILPSVK